MPVPTSVLEYHSAQQGPPSSQPAPSFTAAGLYGTPQRPVAYAHGYPTPPSRPTALSPDHFEPQAQQRRSSQSGSSTSPLEAPSSSRPNPASIPSAYPTPPAHLARLSSPEQLRSTIHVPPVPAPNTFPPAASTGYSRVQRSVSYPSQLPPHSSTSYATPPQALSNSASYGPPRQRTSFPATSSAPALATSQMQMSAPVGIPQNQNLSAPPPPTPLPLSTDSNTNTPLTAVLESAWAQHTRNLEQRIPELESAVRFLDAQRNQLAEEKGRAEGSIRGLEETVRGLRTQLQRALEACAQSAETIRSGQETEGRLRAERDAARGECGELKERYDALRQNGARMALAFRGSMQERAREKVVMEELRSRNAQLAREALDLSMTDRTEYISYMLFMFFFLGGPSLLRLDRN
ncbi:hypothetical protein B0H19DRAFT_1170305 [Mycena capillaripes]|nr:hypothetical protein B0H19DRAFT_1170305 [Mycena capillaripes]